MAINLAILPLGNPIQGNLPPAPGLPLLTGQVDLAVDTASNALTVPAGGAVLWVHSDVAIRVDVNQVEGALAPAASPVVVEASVSRPFLLAAGIWYIEGTAL